MQIGHIKSRASICVLPPAVVVVAAVGSSRCILDSRNLKKNQVFAFVYFYLS